MKEIVLAVALVCVWSKSAYSKSLADPDMYQQYQNLPQFSGSNHVGMYGHSQYPNLGGYGSHSQFGNYRPFHSDPRCESKCPKTSWFCNRQGTCTIISRRACLLKVCPRYIPPTPAATCEFLGDGIGEVSGKLSLQQGVHGVHFKGEVSGLSEGPHGFYVHANGKLTDNCKDAGGHFNPNAVEHGRREAKPSHVGDLGNVEADDEGVAHVDMRSKMTWLYHYGKPSIIGKAIVIHEGDDKFTGGVNGTGDAGKRVGCCLIVKVQPAQSSESSESSENSESSESVESTEISESSRPTVHPTRPTVHPTRPTVHPTRPTVHPTRPTVHPTRPTVRPTRPTVHPGRPTVRPTRPTVRPTRPTVRPTRPTVHPNRPTAHPTDSGSGWFIDGNTGPETNNHREEEEDHDDYSDSVLEASGDDNDDNDNDGGFQWDW